MTELLPLPKLSFKYEMDDSVLPPIELNEEKLSNILTNMVRQKYFDFLEKLLADNYEHSLTDGAALSCQDIEKCAEYLEFEAVRSCMIVHLYRESILNIFTEIRNDTAQKKLNTNLSTERIFQRKTRRNVQIATDLRSTPDPNISLKPTKRRHLRNVRVQTDFFESTIASTGTKYTTSRCFAATRIDYQNRFKENRKRRHSSISLESPHSSVDSSIRRSTERTDSRIDSCTDNECPLTNSSIDASMATLTTPMENATTTDDNVVEEMMALFGDDEETDIFGEVVSTVYRSQAVQPSDKMNTLDRTDIMVRMDDSIIKSKNKCNYTRDLKNSIWPCELHIQRKKLHKALISKADKGFRYSEKLRRKFEDLFGPEADDDEDNAFVPYSPTIEMDEILMSSCKKRIAPWIVKHLKPMSDGLIENRFLFKKVARHIAEKVILQDQYPDEQHIKRAINEFFKTHEYIGSIDDIG